MFINAVPADVLPVIIAGLVREGICFKANPDDDAGRTFTIELTGGH